MFKNKYTAYRISKLKNISIIKVNQKIKDLGLSNFKFFSEYQISEMFPKEIITKTEKIIVTETFYIFESKINKN